MWPVWSQRDAYSERPTVGVSSSMAVISKFLIILLQDWYFVYEVQWDRGTCVRSSVLAHTQSYHFPLTSSGELISLFPGSPSSPASSPSPLCLVITAALAQAWKGQEVGVPTAQYLSVGHGESHLHPRLARPCVFGGWISRDRSPPHPIPGTKCVLV